MPAESEIFTGDVCTTWNYSPKWSPQGDMIAYVHFDVRLETSIRLIDPEGRPLGIVTDDFGVGSLTWSPDGRQLAFTGGPAIGHGRACG